MAGIQLEDGHSSKKSRVNSEGEIPVRAIIEPNEEHLNIFHEKSWAIPFEGIDPTGSDDYFFYLKNTGTKNLFIETIELETSVAGTVEVHEITGTNSAISDIVPVNKHLGSTLILAATVGTGVDITGLSNVGTTQWARLDTVNKYYAFHVPGGLLIPPGRAIALLWDQTTGILKGTVHIMELLELD